MRDTKNNPKKIEISYENYLYYIYETFKIQFNLFHKQQLQKKNLNSIQFLQWDPNTKSKEMSFLIIQKRNYLSACKNID